MIFQGNDLKRSVTPSPSRVKFSSNRNSISSSRRSSSSQRRLRTPVVPDEAFVSRPKLINSLDVSSISEMLAVDQSLPDNSMETSIAGHSKLVDAFIRAGTRWIRRGQCLSLVLRQHADQVESLLVTEVARSNHCNLVVTSFHATVISHQVTFCLNPGSQTLVTKTSSC